MDQYNNSSEDTPLYLVFFGAFEDLLLSITGTMERKGVRIDSESFMSPPPFLLSMLAGLRMFSVGFHSHCVPGKFPRRSTGGYKNPRATVKAG